LGRGLAETKALIQDMMNKDLLQVALGYELEHGPPLMPVEALASELDLRLSPLALGLLRLRVLHDALRALQDQLKKDVRALIKRRLQELLEAHGEASRPTDAAAAAAATAATATAAAAADGLPASDATAADGSEPKVVDGGETVKPAKKIMDQLRELSLDGFEAVMAGVVAPLMVLLRRAAAIHTALKKALAASLAMSVTRHADGGEEEEEEDAAGAYAKQVEQQSAETLQAVCELAHERYARLLKVTQRSHARPPLHCLCFVSPPRPGPPGSCQQVRKEVHTKLPLTLFVRVNRVAVEFIRDVQHLCGQPCHALGTELQQHANAFLDATHAEAARKLEAIVEVEQWKQVDIPSDYQDIVGSLVRKQVPKIQEAELLKLRENDAADKATAKELIVDGAAYKVSQTGPVLAPGALPTAMQLELIRLSAVATGGQQRTALALHGHALPAVLGQSANRFHPRGPEAAGAAQNLPHQGLPAGLDGWRDATRFGWA
jgi:hypothetical protein